MEAEPFWQKGYQNSEHLTTGALCVTQVVHRFTNLLPQFKCWDYRLYHTHDWSLHFYNPPLLSLPSHQERT